VINFKHWQNVGHWANVLARTDSDIRLMFIVVVKQEKINRTQRPWTWHRHISSSVSADWFKFFWEDFWL